jgi:hypothetical protein
LQASGGGRRVAPFPQEKPKEEVAVPVVLVSPPGFTREQYEESVRRLHPDGGQLASPSDWPVEGLLVHIAGEGENGFRVVDVWESEDAVQRFGDIITPIMRELGVEGDPEIYPTHTFVSA